jgi:hypothetical protein
MCISATNAKCLLCCWRVVGENTSRFDFKRFDFTPYPPLALHAALLAAFHCWWLPNGSQQPRAHTVSSLSARPKMAANMQDALADVALRLETLRVRPSLLA